MSIPAILTPKRTEYGKRIRKAYESHQIYEKRANMVELVPRSDGLSNTLTTFPKDNILLQDGRMRYLTPLECMRLQGFPDECSQRMIDTLNKHSMYKLTGNTIAVPCLYHIFKKAFVDEDFIEIKNPQKTLDYLFQ